MWECDYAREPVNYRLFFLRLLKKIWILPLAAIIGAVVVGGIYYFVKIVVGDGYQYRANTMYYVTYSKDANGTSADYYNYYTWQEVIGTAYFTDALVDSMDGKITREFALSNITATVEFDPRYMYTKTVSSDKELSVEVEHELAKIMQAFADTKDEIELIEVLDEADTEDIEDISLIFIDHAVILGAIIGLLAGFVFYVFASCVDTSVYVPATLEKRYHIPVLGAPSMSEFGVNCRHFIAEKNVMLVKADEHGIGDEALKEIFKDYSIKYIYSDVFSDKDAMDELAKAEGIVVVVCAGANNGKRIERLIEQFARLKIDVTAFALVGEDEWLIKKYYR